MNACELSFFKTFSYSRCSRQKYSKICDLLEEKDLLNSVEIQFIGGVRLGTISISLSESLLSDEYIDDIFFQIAEMLFKDDSSH